MSRTEEGKKLKKLIEDYKQLQESLVKWHSDYKERQEAGNITKKENDVLMLEFVILERRHDELKKIAKELGIFLLKD